MEHQNDTKKQKTKTMEKRRDKQETEHEIFCTGYMVSYLFVHVRCGPLTFTCTGILCSHVME